MAPTLNSYLPSHRAEALVDRSWRWNHTTELLLRSRGYAVHTRIDPNPNKATPHHIYRFISIREAGSPIPRHSACILGSMMTKGWFVLEAFNAYKQQLRFHRWGKNLGRIPTKSQRQGTDNLLTIRFEQTKDWKYHATERNSTIRCRMSNQVSCPILKGSYQCR